jgi:hypothetical protein
VPVHVLFRDRGCLSFDPFGLPVSLVASQLVQPLQLEQQPE